MRSPLAITIFSLLLDLIAFTMILPLFPSILQYYKENDPTGFYKSFAEKASVFGKLIGAPINQPETVLMGGILGSLFCFLQFLSSPLLGAFSDVYGRKKALIICMIGICSSHVLWLFATSFPLFILARVVGGLSRANVSISTTIIADDSPPEKRTKGMAFIGVAFSVGFTVGPGIGALFARKGDYVTPAFVSLLLSLASLFLIIFYLDETLDKKYRAKSIKPSQISSYIWPPHLFQFKAVSVGQQLKPIGLAFFIYIFIYSGLEFTLTFLTHAKFNYTPVEQGKMFTFLGLTMALFQGTVTRRMTPDMESSAAMIGMLLMVPSFVIIGFAQDTYQLLFGLFCYSLGSAIVSPCLTSMAAAKVDRSNEKGVSLGIFRSLGALARSFGPFLASSLFWCYGPSITYVAGALCMLFPLYLLKRAVG